MKQYFSLQPYQSLSGSKSDDLRSDQYEPIDTKEPLDIIEEEELERISGLLQRDNLVRGLGIVEHVYRLLHCTPGTMSMQLKPSDKYHVSSAFFPDVFYFSKIMTTDESEVVTVLLFPMIMASRVNGSPQTPFPNTVLRYVSI